MRIILLLSTFFAFLSLASGTLEETSLINFVKFVLKNFGMTGRIVNGTKASSGQFPHQVSLSRSWSKAHFCGGSIISANLVLTAAHCMFSNTAVIRPWTILLIGGILKLDEKSESRQERGVKNIRLHPNFDLNTLHNDIAVLELLEPFKFTPELRSAVLPRKPLLPNIVCQVSGWGYPSSDNRTVSNDLMYVDIPVLSTEECRELLVNVTDLPEGMFCAGWLDGGKDSCQGDSGGGMICNDVLVGIVSGGEGCALPRLPGIYTNVVYFKDWILKSKPVIMIEKNDDASINVSNNDGFNGST